MTEILETSGNFMRGKKWEPWVGGTLLHQTREWGSPVSSNLGVGGTLFHQTRAGDIMFHQTGGYGFIQWGGRGTCLLPSVCSNSEFREV